MFISKLKFNTNLKNPGIRAVMKDLKNPYELHRTIMRAFPENLDKSKERVLFRKSDNNDHVIVLSKHSQNWNFLSCDYGEAKTKEFENDFARVSNRVIKLDILLNATKRINGKRIGLSKLELEKWFPDKMQKCGFQVVEFNINDIHIEKFIKAKHKQTFMVSHVTAYGKIKDAELFSKVYQEGVGSGKGYGYGMINFKVI